MARLSTSRRKALPASTFGLPGSRKYPMPDRSHAANAKARASQAVKAGRMSASTEQKIDAKANRILGKSKPKHAPYSEVHRYDWRQRNNLKRGS